MKINIGCGTKYKDGWMNTDISDKAKCDVINDIGKEALPVYDREAEEIVCEGVLEQIQSNEEFIHAMNEMWRVLKEGGEAKLVVPNAEYSIAFQDPMDVRKFTPQTFAYFMGITPEYKNYGKLYGFKPWNDLKIEENENHILEVTLIK